jgi:hypothetical protein
MAKASEGDLTVPARKGRLGCFTAFSSPTPLATSNARAIEANTKTVLLIYSTFLLGTGRIFFTESMCFDTSPEGNGGP